LIEGRGLLKHNNLTGYNNGNHDLVESAISSERHTSLMDLTLNTTWIQSQMSEHIEFIVTYKIGTLGDIPFINGCIELTQAFK
jgi:hypothetical protein